MNIFVQYGTFYIVRFISNRYSGIVMTGKPWILIAVLILIVLLGIIAIMAVKYKKKQHKPDYYVFFVMGLIWLPFGIATENSAFFILGLVFMALGLVHKDEWKKNHRPWKKMDKTERKIWLGVIFAGLVLLLLTVVVLYLTKRGTLFCS